MKLVEYMPPYLKNVLEFNKIFDTEDIEIENMRYLINKILREVIVKTANSYGLERYEKIYGITNKAETIEARRMNILFKINNRVPYTLKWLINTLNESIGENNYKLVAKDYELYITINLAYTEAAEMLKSNLIKQIPANIKMDIDLFAQTTCYMGANIRQVSYEKIDTCIETINEKEKVSMNEIIGANIREQSYINIKSNSEVYKEKEIIDTNTSIGTVISRQDYINIEEVEK